MLPFIENAPYTDGGKDSIRFASLDHADSTMIVAVKDFKNQVKGIGFVGIGLRRNFLLKEIEEFLPAIDIGENLSLVLYSAMNSSEEPGKMNGKQMIEDSLFLLDGTIQGYKLGLMGIQGMSIQDFTSRSVLPYYALLIIITLVLAFGVVFIIHDISREHELSRMKSEFISNVTHEIKTPIATIRSLAENVNEGWVSSKDQHKTYFRLIAQESERLGHLVKNTLDFSRMESGNKRFWMEESSPEVLIENTLHRFRILAEGRQVKVSCDMDKKLPIIRVDKDAIEQALLNLLDNAVKYSPAEKVVKVVVEPEGDYLKIAVSDRGTGIDKKDQTRLFEKFYRSEMNSCKKISGSGLGLTIVKEIVDAHGGKVKVESELKKGSTFTIYLPIVRKAHDGEDTDH
jgi:signal transduction histidine kinase